MIERTNERKQERRRERKKGHRPSESNRCFFIVEAGGCTEDSWLRGSGVRNSAKPFTELALKGAESHLLLSKAGCCPKPPPAATQQEAEPATKALQVS